MSVFMSQIKANLFEHRFIQTIPNEVICVSKGQTLQDWVNSLKDENFRRELMQRGEVFAKLFLSYRRNYTSTPNTSPVQKTNSIEILVQTPALEENDAINKIIVNHDIVDVNDLPVDDLPVDVDVQPVDVDVQPVDVDDHQVDADEVISNDNNKEII
jgi:hypothetical protein